MSSPDRVVRKERSVTVTVGGVSAIKEYPDVQRARRAERRLIKSEATRLNFFRRLKGR